MNNLNKKTLLLLTGSLLLILLVVALFTLSTIKIKSVSPSNKSENVSAQSNIEFVFTRNLNANQQKSIKVDISPSTPYATYWSPSGNLLQLAPLDNLEAETKYEVRISYLGKKSSFEFSTISKEANEILNKKAEIDQGKSDAHYAAQEKKFLDQHVWYDTFPQRTDAYFLAFDPTEDKFFADIYIDVKKAEDIKADVINYLTSLGVDLKKYQIEWVEYKSAATVEF